jgi:hypothetical protein
LKACSVFVVAGGKAAELFQAGEAAFNAVPLLIEFLIVGALLFAVGDAVELSVI